MSIGENIKNLREERNISQYALAKMLGVTQQAVDQWERSKTNPKKKTLEKISSMFNVSVDEIFNGSKKADTENKKPADLNKFLNNTEIMFNGEIYKLNEKDREKMRNALEFVFWEAKKMNKRKKS